MGPEFEVTPSIVTMGNHDYAIEGLWNLGRTSLYPYNPGNLDKPPANAPPTIVGCWVPSVFGLDAYSNAWNDSTLDYEKNNNSVCGRSQGVPAGWTLGLYPWGKSAFLTVDNVYKVEWMLDQYPSLRGDLQKAIGQLQSKGVTDFYLVSHWNSFDGGPAEVTATALSKLKSDSTVGHLFQNFNYLSGHDHSNLDYKNGSYLVGGNGFGIAKCTGYENCCPSILQYQSGQKSFNLGGWGKDAKEPRDPKTQQVLRNGGTVCEGLTFSSNKESKTPPKKKK